MARLEREARTVAGLNHPNIITLYSIEEDAGVRFLTMELVEGRSLGAMIEPGGLPVARVLEIAIPLADALVAAHGKRVVHRDLKPANMIFKFGPLVLLGNADFRTAFTEPQRDALLQGVFGVRRGGAWVTMIFWGLWLFPFGRLVIKSNFPPRILGVLLMIAGVGYLVSGVTSIVLPDHRQMVNRITMPLYFGELPIIFWLLIAGARQRVRSSVASRPLQPRRGPDHCHGVGMDPASWTSSESRIGCR